ncbi:MAG: carboxypeptidase regulatory-like domain-containing protein, partial [Bacteroidota bacterium]
MLRNVTIFSVLLIFACVELADAQRSRRSGGGQMPQAEVSGRVVDGDAGTPIEYGTVAVWSVRDSTLAAGAVTDAEGKFTVDGLRPGRYYARISFIGYQTQRVDDIRLGRQGLQADLGTIQLAPDLAQIGEVEVSAERNFVQIGVDRNVYSTRDQITASGGSTTDVLR